MQTGSRVEGGSSNVLGEGEGGEGREGCGHRFAGEAEHRKQPVRGRKLEQDDVSAFVPFCVCV